MTKAPPRSPHVWGSRALMVLCALVALGSGSFALGCDGGDNASNGGTGEPVVLADMSFMADIAQNVAGDRFVVSSLLPTGADPHSFEPTPRDAKRIVDSDAVIINIHGFEPLVDDLIAGAADPDLLVIEAGAGVPGASEDPHLWLDPLNVITYVNNIAEDFATIDPAKADTYRSNAEGYAADLRELDQWIAAQVQSIPAERRLLVTNHEVFGHFAKRYGFQIVGTIFATVAGDGSPSAQQLAALVADIRATGAPAIFLETGGNTDLADQLAQETGVKVITELYTHSLGENACTYVDMMRWNVQLMVEALR